jgi:DNA-binding response OmpR family regulator
MPTAENPNATILLVDGDLTFTDVLRPELIARGYRVWTVASAAEAEDLVASMPFDLVILEVLLPDAHGLVLCANLRDRITTPIIICTGSTRPEDLLLGFRLGATDVVRKPIATDELEARINAALRGPTVRTVSPAADETMHLIGPLAIDQARCRVTIGGQPIHLTPTEYRLLCILADRPNHVLSSQELTERVWGFHDPGIRRSLGSHIRRVRGKLKRSSVGGPDLKAVRGLGYELTWEPAAEPLATDERQSWQGDAPPNVI